MSRWRSGGRSAYSELESFCFSSATVVLGDNVRVYFASLEDLMVKVTGVSSTGASSAMAFVERLGTGAESLREVIEEARSRKEGL